MPYKIINWGKYQVRNDRKHNPWIKLDKNILTSGDFFGLPVERRWEWFPLLCLAEHSTGVIDESDKNIAFKLRYPDEKTFDPKPFLDTMLQEVVSSGDQWLPKVTKGCLEEEEEEEERRGEEDGQEPQGGTRPPDAAEVLRDPKNSKPYVMPLKAKGASCTLPRSKGLEWEHTFGDSFDVPRELRKCIQYYLDNPAKRKTDQQNAMRSIGNWMRKTQNDGSGQPPASQAEKRKMRERMKKAREADEAQAKRVEKNTSGRTRGDPEPLDVSEVL